MKDFKKWAEKLLQEKIGRDQVTAMRQELFSDGRIDKDEAEFLANLKLSAKEPDPSFDTLFIEGIQDYVLATGGAITEDATRWLKEMVFGDGKTDDAKKALLTGLKEKAKTAHESFAALYAEKMEQSAEKT